MSCPKCWDPEVCWECSPKTAELKAENKRLRSALEEIRDEHQSRAWVIAGAALAAKPDAEEL